MAGNFVTGNSVTGNSVTANYMTGDAMTDQTAQQSTAAALPRAGEWSGNPLIAERRSRVFRLPNGWYFNTREKIPLGPFVSAEKAERETTDFLRFLNQAPEHVRNLFQRDRFSAV